MKVVVAHEFYRSSAPSGEDAVVRNERTLLEASGIEVIPFDYNNDDIDVSTFSKRVALGIDTVWSRRSYRSFRRFLRKVQPDVVHCHNTFPVLSPSIYSACRDEAAPVVQTLHNYRLICPNALLMRGGQPCEACVGRLPLPALRYRCYRDSVSATLPLALMIGFNRMIGLYRTGVARYIALTRFAAAKLKDGGLPANRVMVKPNFLPEPPLPGTGDGGYAVFVGRLTEEKGVRTLLQAWRRVHGLPLKIVGDGSLRNELESMASKDRLEVDFLGSLKHTEVLRIVGRALLQIIPSECYEGFPMVVLEAYACGTPIVASRIGSLDELVAEGETGRKFQAADPNDLAMTVTNLVHERDLLTGMRTKCREIFENNYSAARSEELLRNIYREAIESQMQS